MRRRPGEVGAGPAEGAGWVGLVVGGVLALLVLGPLLVRGYVLTYDMVFVPRLEFGRGLLGLDTAVPRAVPADLLVALASRLVPADLVQKLVLAGVFVGAATGSARLLPSTLPAARAATAALYVWNPFLYERLIMGHWGLLVSYAALPLGRQRGHRPPPRNPGRPSPPGPDPGRRRRRQPTRRPDRRSRRPLRRHHPTVAGVRVSVGVRGCG